MWPSLHVWLLLTSKVCDHTVAYAWLYSSQQWDLYSDIILTGSLNTLKQDGALYDIPDAKDDLRWFVPCNSLPASIELDVWISFLWFLITSPHFSCISLLFQDGWRHTAQIGGCHQEWILAGPGKAGSSCHGNQHRSWDRRRWVSSDEMEACHQMWILRTLLFSSHQTQVNQKRNQFLPLPQEANLLTQLFLALSSMT